MTRREFIALLGVAAAWPLAAHGQQPGKLPTIGFLGANPSIESQRVAAFVQRLRELGWIEGRTVSIEYRWAEGRSERYAENVAELVRLKVDVIVTSTTPPSLAAKQATAVIPIVFAAANDPVGTGLIASLARPGGNVTGLANQMSDTSGKKLEFLREVVPGLRRLAIMANAGNPGSMLDMSEAQATARRLGLEVARYSTDASRPRRRGDRMNRREFITLLGGAAAAWPVAARAQQDAVKTIGFLNPAPLTLHATYTVFSDALRELGWIEGKNLAIVRRSAENQLERLPDLAAELVRLNVDVIVATGTLAPLAAKQATTTIPIVMANAGDPLGSGLIPSLSRPGGNITGMSLMAPDLGGKRLELLKEFLPGLSRVAVLWNSVNPYSAQSYPPSRRCVGTGPENLLHRT
jgi:putative ABC transport system substrate-binding protein